MFFKFFKKQKLYNPQLNKESNKKKDKKKLSIFRIVTYIILIIITINTIPSILALNKILSYTNTKNKINIIFNNNIFLKNKYSVEFTKNIIKNLENDNDYKLIDYCINNSSYWSIFGDKITNLKYLFYLNDKNIPKIYLKNTKLKYKKENNLILLNSDKLIKNQYIYKYMNIHIFIDSYIAYINNYSFYNTNKDKIITLLSLNKNSNTKSKTYLTPPLKYDEILFQTNYIKWDNFIKILNKYKKNNLLKQIKLNNIIEVKLKNNKEFIIIIKNCSNISQILNIIQKTIAYNNKEEKNIKLKDNSILKSYYLNLNKYKWINTNNDTQKIQYKNNEYIYIKTINKDLIISNKVINIKQASKENIYYIFSNKIFEKDSTLKNIFKNIKNIKIEDNKNIYFIHK